MKAEPYQSDVSPNHQDIANLVDECAKEPIHISGCIQPFGVLLTVDPQQLIIQNLSENCVDHWGISAHELIGKSFTELMHVNDLIKLRTYLSSAELKEQTPLSINLPAQGGKLRETWELSAHYRSDLLIIELETIPRTQFYASLPFHRRIRESVQALQHVKNLTELCNQAATEVKAITGFDRVMIYQFDEEWHGVVVAESINPSVDSYLGHHFPASDIPPQARQIFIDNWLRMIPDALYQPSTIIPGIHPHTKAPVDLSEAKLRSVSPIHIEYLRNMNVRASLTVSLIDDGKLWGLIACHHNTPLRLRSEDRLGAQLVGQIVSSQLRVKESQEHAAEAQQLRVIRTQLISQLEASKDLAEGFTTYGEALMDFGQAKGLALFYAGRLLLIGETPDEVQMKKLESWLKKQIINAPFTTNMLSRYFQEAEKFQSVASGLLCIPIPKMENGFIVWFRPEVASTVVWAGKPEKITSSGKLHPRASFESWTEIVKGQSKPWRRFEVEAFDALRNDLIALDLKFQFDKEQAARARAEKISREKDDMVAVVSHDLKMPLNSVKLTFDLLSRGARDLPVRMQQLIERGIRATQNMEQLIIDILDIAKIESGSLILDLQLHDVTNILREVADFSRPLAAVKSLELNASMPDQPIFARCERNRIFQVLSNLVGNAIKFTPPQGRVELSLYTGNNRVVFSVSDTGSGIEKENLKHIFDRFWQAPDTSRLGTGLGLSIAKGIIENHGGQIWVESEFGQGSQFFVALPAL